MRMTLTLDDDIAGRLEEETRRSGKSLKEIVNSLLRLGFSAANDTAAAGKPFVVRARHLGKPAPGLDLDNVAELLEQVEGPGHL